jgi:hypothetical protein
VSGIEPIQHFKFDEAGIKQTPIVERIYFNRILNRLFKSIITNIGSTYVELFVAENGNEICLSSRNCDLFFI